jgi:class 3 adenylate cyclase
MRAAQPRSSSLQLAALRRFVLGEPLPPHLEQSFRVYARHTTVRVTRVLAWFLLVCTLLSWPSDRLMFARDRSLQQAFFVFRATLAASLTGLLLALAGRAFREGRLAVVAIAAVTTLLGGMAGFSAGLMGGLDAPYFYTLYAFGGLTLIFFVGPWARLLIAGLFSGAACAGFFLPFPAHAESPHVWVVLAVLLTADLAYVVVGHVLYRFARTNQIQAAELEIANRKSEALLLNILPAAIAARLKEHQQPIADGFAEVSVLFADLAGFTPLSESLPPEGLVRLLNRVFSEFDRLADRHGLEKIKTIGDAYMVAGGIPRERPDHAEAVADMALDMLAVTRGLAEELGVPLRLRVGIHSGPVVAGVIGVRKFIYDLWGDTVNIASRMESHGVPGEIQVSAETARRLVGRFRLEPRGEIEVKGKGPMATCLLKGRLDAEVPDPRPAAASGTMGCTGYGGPS